MEERNGREKNNNHRYQRERETDGRIVSGKRERKDIEEKDKWGRD